MPVTIETFVSSGTVATPSYREVAVSTTSGFVVLVASAQAQITSATCNGAAMNLLRYTYGGNQGSAIYYLGGG